MTESNMPLSARETYTPSWFTECLWWFATAEKEIITDSVIDRNRYRIIGMTVMATWIFASLAWMYFFSTVTDSVPVTVMMGLFMGFIILIIDRALIKGINRFNKRKLLPLFTRAALALIIGTFLAQPAVLYMFDKEIRLQASVDNVKRKQQKNSQLEILYKNRKTELVNQKEAIEKNLAEKYDAVSKAREQFLAESDGSGGTGKIGLKDIAIAKRQEYQKLDEEYQALFKENKPRLEETENAIKKLDLDIQKEESDFAGQLNNGFLTRVEALHNLLSEHPALQFRYLLIVFILMLIELMPVISKAMLPAGSYDEKVKLREEMEIFLANSNIRREQQLKELYNSMAFEHDSEMIRSFFSLMKEEAGEKVKAFGSKWRADDRHRFDGLWQKMKKEILSRQEN